VSSSFPKKMVFQKKIVFYLTSKRAMFKFGQISLQKERMIYINFNLFNLLRSFFTSVHQSMPYFSLNWLH